MAEGIELRGVTKIFGADPESALKHLREGVSKQDLKEKENHTVGLNDVSITMPGGKIQVVMGLSGSGKSTLIRHINRLIEPTAGAVLHEGRDILSLSAAALREFRRKKTAMVFQKFALMPHRTVIQNVLYGLNIQSTPRAQAEESARHWINRVGLAGFEESWPQELSGGMQQRVGLARALATDADILLMDEAFSALDPLIRSDMQQVLLDIQEELQKTIVFITHDLDEALRLGDRIAILRDGELVQDGVAREILLEPADDYVEAFVRDVNRAKVLTLYALARPIQPGEDADVMLDRRLTLSEAARQMVDAGVSVATVQGRDGPLGVVSLHEVVGAMVGPVREAA